ncbi:MAG TPA: hypothetical protein VFJ58_08140 [Armatimonadota bacterium]|nr:hypothetical protein [Armatimonadota bacterium]
MSSNPIKTLNQATSSNEINPPETAEMCESALLGVCQYLRNKKMSYLTLAEALDPASDRATGNLPVIGHGAPPWCFHTQGAVGPDGGFVSIKRCVAGRRCHRPY